MVEMNTLKSPQMIEAVRIWTGWGQGMAPNRDDARLAEQLGNQTAAEVLPLIKSLEDDFYSSNARIIASDLQEMEKLAAEDFKRKYPYVPDEIVKAFAWCYTFDFK
jgi:hypothetical protein